MKVLILRFSSIGDVLQCLSVAGAVAQKFPEAEIHWVTRQDLAGMVETHPQIQKVFSIKKGEGLSDLWKLAQIMRAERYTHIYDAHNNLRSRILCWFLYGPFMLAGRLRGMRFIRRPIKRFKRFFLFRFRWNLFRQPFSGQRDLLEPLTRWGIPELAPQAPQMFVPQEVVAKARAKIPFSNYIALAPSAAYPLKRWPLEYWKQLIRLMPEQNFVVLGGREDNFLADLTAVDEKRVINLAGELSLNESAAVVGQSQMLVANDTGVLHMGEQLGKETVALMGPAPFGFPSRERTKIMELHLACRPCSKHGQGPCVNPEFHKCLAGIAPESVATEAQKILRSSRA